MNMKVMTASETRELRVKDPKHQARVDNFNARVDYAVRQGLSSCCLAFNEFGFEYEDVAWIRQAGYAVTRNGPCLWWEVSWEEKE